MWFKVFKKLTQPGEFIFLALVALLISLGLQFAVMAGALSVVILNAAAPILLGIFLGFVTVALVAAVGWPIRYFYKDYQKEKSLDEKIKKILEELPAVSESGQKKSANEIGQEFEEEAKTSPEILEIGATVSDKLSKKLKRDYEIADFNQLSNKKRQEILETKFSYQKAFFNACKDWCKQHEKAIIIAGALLVGLMITLIVFSSLALAGAPVPFLVGFIINGIVGFFETGFVGLGVTTSSAFAAHHLVASILAGIIFCLGPVNIISTFQKFGSALYDMGLWVRQKIEKSPIINNSEDVPLPTMIPKNESDENQLNDQSQDVFKKSETKKKSFYLNNEEVDNNAKVSCCIVS